MSLADQIDRATQPVDRRCKYAQILHELRDAGDPDVDRFAELVSERVLTGPAAARALKAENHPVSADTITKHLRGGCGCES